MQSTGMRWAESRTDRDGFLNQEGRCILSAYRALGKSQAPSL